MWGKVDAPGAEWFRRAQRRRAEDGAPREEPGTAAFQPDDVTAMCIALDEVCKALNIAHDDTAREIVAMRIIDVAQQGERSAAGLRDRVLAESNGGTRC
jgi:hypothetical protein